MRGLLTLTLYLTDMNIAGSLQVKSNIGELRKSNGGICSSSKPKNNGGEIGTLRVTSQKP